MQALGWGFPAERFCVTAVEYAGDLLDGLLPLIVEPLGERGWSAVSLGQRPPPQPRARAEASPSLVFATISSHWSSARTDSTWKEATAPSATGEPAHMPNLSYLSLVR